jgi:DNA-binding transcriptional LysR family regulator
MDVRLAEMTGEIGGSLLVGASTTIAEFMLPRILGEFKSAHPNVRPRLVVANSETIETRVAEHTIDIGFIESPSHQPNLETETCCDDELQVICSPKFPLSKFKELTPSQLTEHPYVSREPGSGTREFTDAYLRKAGIAPDQMKLVMELGSPIALNGVVETGLGFAIASIGSVRKAQRLGDLISIPLKPRLIRTLSMVYPKEKFRSRLVTTFVDFASVKLKQLSIK